MLKKQVTTIKWVFHAIKKDARIKCQQTLKQHFMYCYIIDIVCIFNLLYIYTLLDFKSSCVIKNRRKASKVKVLKFIDQNSAARWVVSQTNVSQRNNTRAIFHNIFIDMCQLVSFSRWPPEPSNAPPTFFSLCSLWVLGTECSHSVYFFVYVLVASSNITSHYIPQCTKKHISYSS